MKIKKFKMPCLILHGEKLSHYLFLKSKVTEIMLNSSSD